MDPNRYELIHKFQAGIEQARNIPVSVFCERLGLDAQTVTDKSVLVAGVGLGNELGAVLSLNPAFVVGVDISSFIFRHPGAMCQADVLRLPFADESFDLVINAGVMHHLENPFAGFQELHRVTRCGGTISIGSIYPPHRLNLMITEARTRYRLHEWPHEKAKSFLRRKLLRRVAMERIGLGEYDLQRTGMPLGNLDHSFDVRLGTLMDTYLPKYRHVIHPQDVRNWFRGVGIEPKLPDNFRRFFTDASDSDFGSPTQNIGIKCYPPMESTGPYLVDVTTAPSHAEQSYPVESETPISAD